MTQKKDAGDTLEQALELKDAGRLDEATSLLIRLADLEKRPVYKAEAIMYLAWTLFDKSDFFGAAKKFSEAIDLASDSGAEFVLGYSYCGLGTASLELNQLSKAQTCLERALVHLKTNSDWGEYVALCTHSLITTFILRGQTEFAYNLLQSAIREGGFSDSDIASMRLNLGHFFYNQADYTKAEEYFKEATAGRVTDEIKGESLLFLGKCLYHLKDYSEARQRLREALPLISNDMELTENAKEFLSKLV